MRSKVFGRILDIGCNDGTVLKDTPFAQNAMGLDLDTWEVPYGLGFKQGDASNLPFKNDEFNCSILGEILEHVKDPVKVLKEARRVVNGYVILTIPYEYNWPPQLKPMMSLEDRIKEDGTTYDAIVKHNTTDNPKCKAVVDDKANPHLWHVRSYTLDTLTEDIEKAGLRYKIEMLSYDGWCFFAGLLK